jgi:hypothetical protein
LPGNVCRRTDTPVAAAHRPTAGRRNQAARRFGETGHRRATARAWNPVGARVMNLTLSLTPLVSLVAGILILVMPKLLNYIVAGYLIVVGLIGLFGLNI